MLASTIPKMKDKEIHNKGMDGFYISLSLCDYIYFHVRFEIIQRFAASLNLTILLHKCDILSLPQSYNPSS